MEKKCLWTSVCQTLYGQVTSVHERGRERPGKKGRLKDNVPVIDLHTATYSMKTLLSWAWWGTTVFLALGRWRQENHQFKAGENKFPKVVWPPHVHYDSHAHKINLEKKKITRKKNLRSSSVNGGVGEGVSRPAEVSCDPACLKRSGMRSEKKWRNV